jgi:hypothetical protein
MFYKEGLGYAESSKQEQQLMQHKHIIQVSRKELKVIRRGFSVLKQRADSIIL